MASTHHHAPSEFNFAFGLAVGLNFAFTIIEAFYAFHSNSMSLLADAGHNLGDVLGLAFAWGANWLLTRKPSERYSYGYKRTTIIAALINALLLVLASGMIAYESFNRLMHPEVINEIVVIIVAVIGIFINGGTAMLFNKGRNVDLNIKAAFLHLLVDASISLGVVLTVTIIYFKKWYWIDPAVGILIVIGILYSSWGLLRDSVNLILDAVPHHIDQTSVKEYLKSLAGVTEIHDLHIWGLSTREIALTVHLTMPEQVLTDEDYIQINKTLRDKFNINHVTVQVEKGHTDDPCGQTEICK